MKVQRPDERAIAALDGIRRCKRCEQSKPLKAFHSLRRGVKTYYYWECKVCRAPKLKTSYKNWKRKNAVKHRKYMRLFVKAAYKKDPSRFKTSVRRWAGKNKVKVAAHYKVYVAVKRGSLVRLSCEECREERVHAHHDDYSKPLAVRWLCAQHHKEAHQIKTL